MDGEVFMNGKTRRAFRRGLTIEYAIIMMVLVTAFVALILTSSTLVTRTSSTYTNYIDRKAFLDEVAAVYIDAEEKETCLQAYEENDFGFAFTATESELIVWQNESAALTVEFTDGVLTAYRYGA